MYPRSYFETFMRYEASDTVFVAMPFAPAFEVAFDTVIAPAIKSVTVNGRALEPMVINRSTSGSPDIHEKIFDAILHSRLVLADMTVQASHVGQDGAQRWQANANVAYEVGLAAAWRNPEDILLVHQKHSAHSYSFDVQNLRHTEYDVSSGTAVAGLASEIVAAIRHSSFLSTSSFQSLLRSLSPTAIQFMYQELRRPFPVIAFRDGSLGVLGAREHAATELLKGGALRNRHAFPQGKGKGVAIIYEWTELGLRLALALKAINIVRREEILAQIASVGAGQVPPQHLLEFPPEVPPGEIKLDTPEATQQTPPSDGSEDVAARSA